MYLFRHILILGGFTLAAISCAKEKKLNLDEAMPPSGMGPKIRPKTQGGTPVPDVNPAALQVTPQEEIVFTDPDNPEAGIPQLESLMANPKKGPWEESETLARQIAAREGKPILIWFTSDRSPNCKTLSSELFADPSFETWARENMVRLRINTSATADDPNLNMDQKLTRQTEIKNYIASVKKRYRVLGYPSLFLLNPSGEVISRYRGYKRGDKDYFWGLIRQGVASSQASYQQWRQQLEAKGYREWRGTTDKVVFAKLISYQKGTLILIEPGGERFRTTEDKISTADKKWISEQKAIRGID